MLAPAPTGAPPPFPPRMAAAAAAAAAAGSPRLSTIRLVFTADTLVAAVDTDAIVMKLLRLVPLLLLLLLAPLLLLLQVLSPPSALAPPTTPTPAVSSRERRFDGDSELCRETFEIETPLPLLVPATTADDIGTLEKDANVAVVTATSCPEELNTEEPSDRYAT